MSESDSNDFTEADEPLGLFERWFAEAGRNEPNDPNAMALATVDASGLPDVRMVLLKGADQRGFVFYTNEQSAKGLPDRRFAGRRRAVSLEVAAAADPAARAGVGGQRRGSRRLFQRPAARQPIGAWASQQSRPLESRLVFEQAIADYAAKFGAGEVPRPPYWRGFRLAPIAIEFWRDRPFRLHDRVLFTRDGANAPWPRHRLYP